MKKNTLLFVMMIAFCWQSNAQFTESFETGIPATWTVLNLAGPTVWEWDDTPSGTGGAQEGSAVVKILSGYEASDDYLITPQISVTAGLNDRLSFYVQSRSGSFLETYEVLLSTTTTAAADFTEVLQVESEAPEDWTQQTFDLTAYVGQSVYVAIRSTSADEWEFYVDNFINDTFPACLEPTLLTTNNIFNTSADLAWTENGTATSWNIEIVDITAGESPTGTPSILEVTNPYTVTGLMPNNEYEFYVQANCGSEGVSIWVRSMLFVTDCDVFMAPFIEDFENAGSIPDCWSTSSDTGQEEWFFRDSGPSHVGNNGTITGNTISNGYYAVCDASSNHGPRFLVTPFVDLSSLTSPEFRFYEISDAEDDVNAQLDVEIWDGSAWNLMETYNTNTLGWELRTVDISGITFTGPTRARFTFSEPNGGGDDDLAIDDVIFDNAIVCTPPTALTVTDITSTTVDLMWDETGTATSWNIEVVDITAGGSVTGVATHTGVTNPYTLTGLLANNNYELYVQADCGSIDGTSSWIGPVSFITDCNAFMAPYTEDFENAGSIPDCWRMFSDSGEEDWFFETSGLGHVGNDGQLSGSTASNGHYAACDASGEHGPRFLLSPFVDVSPLNTPTLSFYEISNSEGSVNAQLDVEVWDGAVWNLMATYNTNTVGWELKTIDISSLTFTGPAQARFTYSEVIDPDEFTDDIAIDDVTFDEALACASPASLSASDITITTADIAWIENGTATSWNIEVVDVTAGDTSTGMATATGVSNPYILTGLASDNDYEYYVQADCGTNGTSIWVGPFAFSTEVVPPACGEIFFDTGGVLGTYSDDEFITTTLMPDIAGEAVTITFSHVDIEVNAFGNGIQDGCWDYLTIYDGPDNTFPVLAQTLCGEESGSGDLPSVSSSQLNVGDSFTSTDASGALTIEFNSDGSGTFSGWAATISCAVLDVDGVDDVAAFTYYPNPVKNTLTLNALNTIENVSIFNMLGQEMLRDTPNNINSELDMSNLNTGTYFLRIEINSIVKTVRIVKQ